MRFAAASLVLFSHSFTLYGIDGEPLAKLTGFDGFGGVAVTIFFVISGYLITASCAKNPSALTYLKNRILRIFPALICVVTLSVLFMGLFVTTLPFREFIRHDDTQAYFMNFLLYPQHYILPEVFTHNPKSAVNGSLWTLPIEFTMYLAVLVLGLCRLLKPRIMAVIFLFTFVWYLHDKASGEVVFYMLKSTLAKNACFFAAGSLAYLWREKIIWDGRIGLLLIVMMVLTAHTPYVHYTYMVGLPYLTLLLGFMPTKHLKNFGKYGDFSYGMYLYAFPVQQTYLHFVGEAYGFWAFVVGSWLITLVCAVLSWHLVEKHALRLKDFSLWKPSKGLL